MHVERNEFRAQTLRGARWGQGLLDSEEAMGMAWQARGSTCTAMGLLWPEDPVGKGFGRLFL